jgi:uncharacterized protein
MNPFRHTGPVEPEDVIDRDDELKRLLDSAESANNSRVLAPREYGKTSLLKKLVYLADLEGWETVYVDFFGIVTLADAADRIERAYRDQLQGDMATWFETVRRRFRRFRLGGGPVPASVDVETDPNAESPLLERLAMPKQILEKRGRRTLIVFDEFQDVLETRDDADEVIRSEIQHHGEAASYVFAGSDLGMMRALFSNRRKAFYRQAARVDLNRLEDGPLGEFIVDRFSSGKKKIDAAALGALLDSAEGHPRAAMLLAHQLWGLTRAEGTAEIEVFEVAEERALEAAAADLRAIWRGLNKSEKGVLTVLARGESPFSRRRSDAGNRGTAAQAAVANLVDAGEVIEENRGYRITDPFLAELLRRGWSAEAGFEE